MRFKRPHVIASMSSRRAQRRADASAHTSGGEDEPGVEEVMAMLAANPELKEMLEEVMKDPEKMAIGLERMMAGHQLGEDDEPPPRATVPTTVFGKQGLAGADTLGLRKLERDSAIGDRPKGTIKERTETLQRALNMDSVAGSKMILDDSWDDTTGRVRSLAANFVKPRGERHDPAPLKGDDLTPQLKLLFVGPAPHRTVAAHGELRCPEPPAPCCAHSAQPLRPSCPQDLQGRDAPAYRLLSDSEFDEWLKGDFAERCKDPKDGKIKADIVALTSTCALHDIPAGPDTFGPVVKRLVQAVKADRTNNDFVPANSNVNHNNVKRMSEIIRHVDMGNYKMVRVTNGDCFKPPMVTDCHFSWATMLGQHLSVIWEYTPPAVEPTALDGATPEDGGGSDADSMAKLGAELDAWLAPGGSCDAADAMARANLPPPPGATSAAMNGSMSVHATEEAAAAPCVPFQGLSLLAEMEAADALEEDTEYRCELIRTRFAQFEEYLDRPAAKRRCVICHKGGANCISLSPGDHQGDDNTNGFEFEDPACFCMTCRECVTERMARCDATSQMGSQRCVACWRPSGGFQVHNLATKKLMLMKAATQLMLFCGPRREEEPEETFAQCVSRRACIKTIMEVGFGRALSIEVGPNHTADFQVTDPNLEGQGWSMLIAPRKDPEAGYSKATGYDPNAINARLLLRMAECEGQLDNLPNAANYARKAVELLSTLAKPTKPRPPPGTKGKDGMIQACCRSPRPPLSDAMQPPPSRPSRPATPPNAPTPRHVPSRRHHAVHPASRLGASCAGPH